MGRDRRAHEWIEWVLVQETDTCLLFPYRVEETGYARAQEHGVRQFVHVRICERVHGAPPTPQHQAAHRCGQRRCGNKRHLRWRTSRQNNREKIGHGTIARGEGHGNAILTAAMVRKIKTAPGYLREIAALYGVSISAIHSIKTGRCWGWL